MFGSMQGRLGNRLRSGAQASGKIFNSYEWFGLGKLGAA